MQNNNFFDYTFPVNSCDIDLCGYLKPSLILSHCQESAYQHSAKMGLGYRRLKEVGTAWVLSRIRVECQRVPAWGEQVRIRTWHKGQSRLFSLRDYIFYDHDGCEIIKVTSSWLIINVATRRLTRIDRLFDDDSLAILEHHASALEDEAQKVELPAEQRAIGEHVVRYSDIDVNQHVNNARYLEWFCDLSPMQAEANRTLSAITLNFNHEALMGEVVSIASANPTESKILLEGTIEGKSIVTAELEYR